MASSAADGRSVSVYLFWSSGGWVKVIFFFLALFRFYCSCRCFFCMCWFASCFVCFAGVYAWECISATARDNQTPPNKIRTIFPRFSVNNQKVVRAENAQLPSCIPPPSPPPCCILLNDALVDNASYSITPVILIGCRRVCCERLGRRWKFRQQCRGLERRDCPHHKPAARAAVHRRDLSAGGEIVKNPSAKKSANFPRTGR